MSSGETTSEKPDDKPPIKPEDVDDPDPLIRIMVAECMNHKGMVIGNVDKDGKLVVKRIEESK